MNTIPGGLRTDQQPPMTIPLCHFLVAMGFLVVGVLFVLATTVTQLPGLGGIASVHVLLVGWICLTIMGAMTQFVPVWSGVRIHSRRLAVAQLWLVAGGLLGFVGTLLTSTLAVAPIFATILLVGVWLFVYNVGRTLWVARPFDRIERHFAVALASFALLAPLGYSLAIDFTTPVYGPLPVTRADIALSHLTLAVFGAILVTVVGALSQLAAMFTQTSETRPERALLILEEATLPIGVFVLAIGRGAGSVPIARVGAVSLLVGALAFAAVIGGRLRRSSVDSSPMTRRYWIVVASLWAWTVLTASAWWADPVGYAARFGHPDAQPVLVLGVFGFVVVGTLYHVVPFIIWMDRYSDRLGFEQVPMIDDLYSSRLERVDYWTTIAGFVGLTASGFVDLTDVVVASSGLLAAIGFSLFVANLLLTIQRHGPGGIGGVLVATIGRTSQSRRSDTDTDGLESSESAD